MKNKAMLILALGMVIAVAACRKETECELPTGIQGEWVWKQSVGGIGGWTLTPESEMITRKLKIDDFVYQEFVNDSLVLSAQYDIEIRDDEFFESNKYLVIENQTEYAFKIEGTTLELFELCFDCFTHQYERQ